MESAGDAPDTVIIKENDDDESDNEDGFEEFLEEKVNRPRRSYTSLAWEFFDIKDSKRKVATCKLCSCDCSYWSSVSNLMKHARRKHFVLLNTQQLDGSSSLSTRQHSQRHTIYSSFWNYYKRLDRFEKLAMCLVCKRQLSYKSSTSNLKKHLKRKHPNLKIENDEKRVILSSDGQLYELEETKSEHLQIDDEEEQPTLDINSVFMDDFEGDLEDSSKKRKLEIREKRRKKMVIRNTSHSDDDTSSDEITFQKRYIEKKKDSLDQFGKYLISLMKQLPKEISNQLQMDFLKQVMTAQATYDMQQKGSVANSGYVISIKDNESQNNSDHQYAVEEHVVETQ